MRSAIDETTRLGGSLREPAAQLGLHIRVSYDSTYDGFYIDAALKRERAGVLIDPELLEMAEASHLAKLLTRELENLQRTLHDATAKAMSERDARGRVYGLSDDDKIVLHEMYSAACTEALRYQPDAIEKYQALMERLYR